MEWNKLNVNILNSAYCNAFKKVILKLIRPEPNQVFTVDSSEWLKFLTRMRLGLSHVVDHKSRHNFRNCVGPICRSGQRFETSTHFTLHCSNHPSAWQKNFFSTILKQIDQVITQLLPFGNEKLKAAQKNPYWRLQLNSYRLPRDLKPNYVPNEMVLLTQCHILQLPKTSSRSL